MGILTVAKFHFLLYRFHKYKPGIEVRGAFDLLTRWNQTEAYANKTNKKPTKKKHHVANQLALIIEIK